MSCCNFLVTMYKTRDLLDFLRSDHPLWIACTLPEIAPDPVFHFGKFGSLVKKRDRYNRREAQAKNTSILGHGGLRSTQNFANFLSISVSQNHP